MKISRALHQRIKLKVVHVYMLCAYKYQIDEEKKLIKKKHKQAKSILLFDLINFKIL